MHPSVALLHSLCLCIMISKSQTLTNRPNIVFIWFDDLGFADTGYNGGDYPTPILDRLANNDAIKINFHYTENVCSSSRSALLTGRYSFRSGANAVVNMNTVGGWDTSNVLFPAILDNLTDTEQYRTFISGKWHIGYWKESLLPYTNGFRAGLYSHQGLQYYSRQFTRSIRRIDQNFGEPSRKVKRARAAAGLLMNTSINIHDTYDITNYVESPVLEKNEEYNEDLYTEAIKEFIAGLNGNKPFFIYYSQWTPHSNLVYPPEIRPDGSESNYTACYNAFPDRVQDNCSLDNDTRCVFCKQVHYASQNIEEIIQEIKDNDNLEWNETIVIITSDNGAAPTSAQGYSYGSALPLRGAKSSGYEGGIRTPAIIKGGFIENILYENEDLENNMCEYNNMIHISDWYHIIMSILEIDAGTNGYYPDTDHDQLGIWNNIYCHCRGIVSPDICDTRDDRKPRNELIMMRMCGNKNGTYNPDQNDIDEDSEFFVYSAYVRKGDYKLVIKGSNEVGETCNSTTDYSGISVGDPGPPLHSYTTAGAETVWPIPEMRYYDFEYEDRRNDRDINNETFNTLYQSICYEELTNDERNNISSVRFRYNDELLYKISEDKIEACALQNETKADALRDIIIAKAPEYTVPTQAYELDLRSLRAQLNSYDCDTGCVYTKPWDHIKGADIDGIWESFIEKYTACNTSSESSEESDSFEIEEDDMDSQEAAWKLNDPYDEYYNHTAKMIEDYIDVILMLIGLLISIILILLFIKKRESRNKTELHQIIENDDDSDASDVTDQEEDDLL